MPHAQAEAARVDEGESEIGLERELHGQDDFGIIGRVQGVAVMRLMARPERDMAEPAEKAEDVDKELI